MPQPRAAIRPRSRAPHHGARRLRKGAPCASGELSGRRPRPASPSSSAA
jgi:hypothetical protein